ncbi:hypothetical protein D3C76_700440 [compost metagenome]
MNRLAQADFALDVDDTATARVHGGGNPRRHTEGGIAHFQHRQAVALADGRAFGVDQDDPGEHVVENPPGYPAGAGFLGLQGTFDMTEVRHRLVRQVTNEVGFADQLEQVADPRRQPSLVLGQARAVGRQARHGGGGQRRQALFRGARLQQLGELLQAVVGQRDVLVEVHQHAEHLLEVRIEVLQRVVDLPRADDDHLQLQRDHLRRQGHGGQAAQFGQRRFHLQLARLQGALERIPDEGLAEHLLRLQHEEATIGAMQCARA